MVASSKRKAVRELPSNSHNEIRESVRDSIGIAVCERPAGPLNADLRRWPDPKERAAIWHGKPPLFDREGDRAVYNLNKEIADYLRGRITVKVGRRMIRTLFVPLSGK